MFVTTVCFWVLVASAAAASCSSDAPFSADIIGQRLLQDMTCFPGRYGDQSIVEVNATHLVYLPTHVGYNFGQYCAELFVFNLNRWAPVMTHYPYLDNLSGNGHQICPAEQERRKVVAWPHGPMRDQYIEGLKKTIAGLTVLRDTDCKEHGYGPDQRAYQHPWVQEPISYLRSVAYNYGLCLD